MPTSARATRGYIAHSRFTSITPPLVTWHVSTKGLIHIGSASQDLIDAPA